MNPIPCDLGKKRESQAALRCVTLCSFAGFVG